jgi:deazaflavin-dependent oxidoreductase (nitroreductase family)
VSQPFWKHKLSQATTYSSSHNQLLVLASNYGAPKHPDWYYNLLVHPNVTVEAGSETFQAIAVPLMGIEREQTWARMVEHYPSFAELQTKTSRQIPIVALKR